MLHKSVGMLLLCVLIAGVAVAAEEPLPVSKKTGYALLDLYIAAFKNMAMAGSHQTLAADLEKMMTEARKAKDVGDIDAPFLARYNRLIAITKLITTKSPDKSALPAFQAELERFVMDVLGEKMKGEGPEGIGQMANALAYDIIDLQIYLDTLESRQQRYDKFLKGFDSPKK